MGYLADEVPSSVMGVAGAGFDTDSSSFDWENVETEPLEAVLV